MGTGETAATQNNNRSISISTVLLIAALVVALLSAWPLISQPGFLNTRGGGDSPFLLQRLQQLEAALRDGHIPVRWMPDANYGYGYPFYNYYAPLSIYIASLFRFLGFSIVRSLELAQLSGFLVAAWGTFLLARHWLKSEWAGFLASVAYTVAPFHLANIYVRGDSLAEFWAMAWYPWILLAADSLLEYGGEKFPYGRICALAVAYAALILSHNISALIFTPFLLLYFLLRGLSSLRSPASPNQLRSNKEQRGIWLTLVWAILLALALAAWFFIPALAEKGLAQLSPVTTGFFHYSNHFRGFDLVQPSALFDYSVAGGKAFRLGLVQAAAIFLGALALVYAAFYKQLVSSVTAIFILSSLLLATFMITPLSRFLWDYLPLLSFTQFPWRFLSVQALAAALAVSALALLPLRFFIVPVTAGILIVSSLAGIRTDYLLLTDEDITPQRLAEYEWFTGNIGSTVSAEYLPPTVQPRPFSSSWQNSGLREDLHVLSGDLLYARQIDRQAHRQSWQLATTETGAVIIFPTLFWPGWQAEIDGKSVELQPAPGSGLIMIELPSGEHTVSLRLGKTTVRWLAEMISLIAIILAVFLLFKARRRPILTISALLPLIIILSFLILLRLWPQESLSASDLTWDFARMGYLHHDQAGVPFDNGAVLYDYDYDRDIVSAGERVTITLGLSDADGESVAVSLGSPAITWPAYDPAPPLIAEQNQTVDSEKISFIFLLPENTPAGLVVPRFTIEDSRPLTPSGKRRGDIFLRPLRIENDPPAPRSAQELDVQAVNVQRRDPTTLDVQLAWVTRQQLSQNYNVSLRLLDSSGKWLSHLDVQPGYGFLPSSGWSVGSEVNDWLAMPLPPDLAEEIPFALVLHLYEVESGEAVLSRRLGDVSIRDGQLSFHYNEPVFTLPDDLSLLPAVFGETIRLHGYQVEQTAADLHLTLYWQALAPNQIDYTRFVHLFDPETETVIDQNDGQARSNSYPTSQWTAGEIVADSIAFDLTDMPSGVYQIGVGFYRQEGEDLLRLPAFDPETKAFYHANRVLLPDLVEK